MARLGLATVHLLAQQRVTGLFTTLFPLPIDLFSPRGRLFGEAAPPEAGALGEVEEEARTLAEAKSPRAGEDDATGEGGRRRELEGNVVVHLTGSVGGEAGREQPDTYRNRAPQT